MSVVPWSDEVEVPGGAELPYGVAGYCETLPRTLLILRDGLVQLEKVDRSCKGDSVDSSMLL